MGLIRLLMDCGRGGKKAAFSKICRTYPTIVKHNTVIPYLKKIEKHIKHVMMSAKLATLGLLKVKVFSNVMRS